ncbi:MAG: FAD-dependent oxidoreductase, partial [Chitinophagales bacterium]
LYNKNQQVEIDQLRFKGQKDKFKRGLGNAAFRKLGASLPDSHIIIREYKKYSGTFNPKALIQKLQLGIKKKGSEIRYYQKVLRITRKQGYYEIKIRNTKTGKIKILQSKKVAIAAGPYTPFLLQKTAPYFRKLITPKKVLLTYFRINKKTYNTYTSKQKSTIRKAQPVFDQNDAMYFSMIDKWDKDGHPIFKVGGHLLQGNIPDLDAVWREQPRKKEVKWALNRFVDYLRMFEIPIRKKDIECMKSSYCVYSVSKTKIPYVTPILTKNRDIDPNMVVIGGMSGTGAKGCLTYGLLAADLLLGIHNSDKMYQRTKKAMGIDRLRKEVRKSFI